MSIKTKTSLMVLASFCALTMFSDASMADVLTLKNGDVITGSVVGLSKNEVSFQTPYAGVLNIAAENVDTLKSDDGITKWQFSQDGDALTVAETPALAEAVEVAQAVQQTSAADTADDMTEEEKSALLASVLEDNLGLQTTGFLRAGGNLQDGNTQKSSVKVEGELKTDLDEKNRLKFKGELNYAEEGDDETENDRSFSAAHDYFYDPKWFISSSLGFKTDKQAELDLRTDIGVGLGYQPYKGDDLNLSMVLGPVYLIEDYETGETEESVAAKWVFDYDQKVLNDRLKLFHNHEILQSIEESENFILESKTGLSVPITDYFSGVLQVDYDFDNAPADGAEKSDTTYSVSLGYEW